VLTTDRGGALGTDRSGVLTTGRGGALGTSSALTTGGALTTGMSVALDTGRSGALTRVDNLVRIGVVEMALAWTLALVGAPWTIATPGVPRRGVPRRVVLSTGARS